MATLTAVSSFLKDNLVKSVKILAGILVIYIIFRVGGVIVTFIAPPPPPSPTVAFAKLPPVNLSEGIPILEGMQFRTETVSGGLPNIVFEAKVFVTGNDAPSFGVLDSPAKIAGTLGFDPKPIELDARSASFQDPKKLSRILTIETATNNFTLTSDFANDPQILSTRPKSVEGAKTTAARFLNDFGIDTKVYSQDKITTLFYKISNGLLFPASSLSEANAVKVIFNQPDIGKTPVVNANFDNPPLWVLVSEKEVLSAKRQEAQIQKHEFAIYPLKGAAAAFDELRASQGVFDRIPNSNVFVVRGMHLAYLTTEFAQPYLQPVYVFEADDDVRAFVGAVDNTWINSELPSGNLQKPIQ